MSVRCNKCGQIAGDGYEIGHRSDCPEVQDTLINKLYNESYVKSLETDIVVDLKDIQKPSDYRALGHMLQLF